MKLGTRTPLDHERSIRISDGMEYTLVELCVTKGIAKRRAKEHRKVRGCYARVIRAPGKHLIWSWAIYIRPKHLGLGE